jgi:hypothetical protein
MKSNAAAAAQPFRKMEEDLNKFKLKMKSA